MNEELANRARDWRVPAELSGSPPRDVKYSAVGIVATVVALALFAGGGVAVYALSNQFNRRIETVRMLEEQGVETSGTVTRLWRGSSKDKPYLIGYEFTGGGRVFHGESRSSREFWQQLSEGQRLTVRYVPANPLWNRPAEVQPETPPVWIPWFMAAFFVGPAALLIYSLRRQRRLLEDGRPAPGVITRSRPTKGGRAIRYEFLLPSGTLAKGRGIQRHGPTEVDSVVTVVYDPDNPNRSKPYPFDMVKISR